MKLGKNVIAGDPAINCCDNRGLFFLQNCEPHGKNKNAAMRRQRYLQPPGSGTIAGDVIGTAMKRHIHRHLMHPYQRPLRPPKLLQTKMVISPSKEVRHGRR